jgi:hypothetical protein
MAKAWRCELAETSARSLRSAGEWADADPAWLSRPARRKACPGSRAATTPGRPVRPARRASHAERREPQLRGGRATPNLARREVRGGSSASRGKPPPPQGGYSRFGAKDAHREAGGSESGMDGTRREAWKAPIGIHRSVPGTTYLAPPPNAFSGSSVHSGRLHPTPRAAPRRHLIFDNRSTRSRPPGRLLAFPHAHGR